jgi:hypothetical protein
MIIYDEDLFKKKERTKRAPKEKRRCMLVRLRPCWHFLPFDVFELPAYDSEQVNEVLDTFYKETGLILKLCIFRSISYFDCDVPYEKIIPNQRKRLEEFMARYKR